MNNLYFLAYEAVSRNTTHRGWRMFELPDDYTTKELIEFVEDKLDNIRSIADADDIVATAFNMVK